MAAMRFFLRSDGLLQAEKQAFSVQEFREAVAQMSRLAGNDEDRRKAIGVNGALDYAERLTQTRADTVRGPDGLTKAGRAVHWSVKRRS